MLLLAIGCADKGGDSGAPPTFTQVYEDVLQPSCAFSTCHGGSNGSGDFGFTDAAEAYAALVGIESLDSPGSVRVVAGDPDASYLVAKLEAAAGIVGDPMPPPSGIEAERAQLVRAWIAAGALQD